MNVRLTDKQIMKDINYAGVKVCKNCEVEYPATRQYFYQASGNKDGLRCECKRCTDKAQYQKKVKDLKVLDNVKVAEEKDKKIKEVESINKTWVGAWEFEKGEKERREKQVGGLLTALATVAILAAFAIAAMYFYKF